jgi:hypothetical protein
MLKLGFFSLLIAAVFCAGCASQTADEAAGQEADVVSGSRFESADGALSVTLRMLDGVQAATASRRFTTVVLRRGGSSFTLFCNEVYETRVRVGAAARSELHCGEHTLGEDADHFDLAFIREGGDLRLEVTASWEADMFGEHYRIATGQPFVGVPHSDNKKIVLLEPKRLGTPDGDPMALLSLLESAAAQSLGAIVHVDGKNGPLTVRGDLVVSAVRASVGDTMMVALEPSFGDTSVDSDVYSADETSLLRTAGSPASGVVAEDVLAARIHTALKAR